MRPVILLLILVSIPVFAQSPPAFKSFATGSGAADLATIATSTTLNVAPGDAVIVCIGRGRFGRTIGSITDGGSNSSFTQVGSTSTSGVGETVGDVDMWILTGASANAAATFTATFAAGATSIFRWIGAGVYSGIATSSAIDQSSCSVAGCGSTTSANVTAVNVTTTQADELLAYCGYNNNASTWTGASSFTMRAGTSGIDSQLADRVVSATGTYPSGNIATLSNTPGQVGVFGTFKAATGGGGGGTTVPKRGQVF